ncbi:MAG TPA: replication initiator [Nocardioidaceae bacterium]|nr:replication initiator [Nocardioidaceae bacterium]
MSTRTRSRVYDVLPAVLPQAVPGWASMAPVDLIDPSSERQILELLGSADFDSWSEALDRVGNCAHPIRLRGRSETVDVATGEIISSYASDDEPLGVTHVRCGNRRASRCPSCSRLYAADMFQLLRAGVCGGKTVPRSVADNPLVFATLTAPSFGPVHGRREGGPCRPGPTGHCEHGRSRSCHERHGEDDLALGQPLCGDCYDHESHVVWQWWAPDLWRRFTIALRRAVAKALGVPATRVGEVATVQYAKVAEYQVRGVIHFHALVRLDGPRTPDGFAPAPAGIDAAALALLVHQAAAAVRLTAPGVDDDDPSRVLAFGRQLDVRAVHTGRRTDDPERGLSPEQVAGYLAKYATKSVDDSTTTHNSHHRRLRAAARHLAARATAAEEPEGAPYGLLGKWVHTLGFRGHFASKSRRYSVTLRALRRARRRAQVLIAAHRAEGRPLDLSTFEADLLADDEAETTLVVGTWQYLGSGWSTDGERVLAVAAAARAREYAQEQAQQRREQRNEQLREHTQGEGNR